MTFLDWSFVALFGSVFLLGLLNSYLCIYIWSRPRELALIGSPKVFEPPRTSFTVLLPARHEEEVISQTILGIARANYPVDKVQILVICEESDHGTIAIARQTRIDHDLAHVSVITFSGLPINKPRGLNEGLAHACHEVVVIFDAEDEVHPDIFNVANTVFLQKKADIFQAGVQLMNHRSSWFSLHNVLEYYFWFKSRMHFYIRIGMVPLGGNTVFFRTELLRRAGGWDVRCLTEDAEVGIRLSLAGAKVCASYDSRHVTREETPDTLAAFIKQRTRWNQGFLQILKAGHWRHYPRSSQKLLCFYTLGFSLMRALFAFVAPLFWCLGWMGHLPVLVSMMSFLPLIWVLLHLAFCGVGIVQFCREQRLAVGWKTLPLLVLTMIPYQLLLSVSALRAVWRQLTGVNQWEKTHHKGLHRLNPAPAANPVSPVEEVYADPV